MTNPPVAISAAASSGLMVNFSSSTRSVRTVNRSTVTLVAAGTCTITANLTGNGIYSAATPVAQNFTVALTSGGSSDADSPIPAWALGFHRVGRLGAIRLWSR